MPQIAFQLKLPIRVWHAICLLMCLVVGCSQQPTEVAGRVTLDGKPLVLDENVRGTVVFQPASRQGPTLNGVIDRRGEFHLSAGSSSSVAPGVYLVTVSAVEIQQATEDNPQAVGRRITPAKYASSADSGLRVAVAPGENQVLLELGSESEQEAPVDDEEVETAQRKPSIVQDEDSTKPLNAQEK